MRVKSLLLILWIALFGALSGAAWANADEAASKRCLKCHDEDAAKFARHAHGVKADARTPTCVSCHGPSEAHIKKASSNPPDRKFNKDTELTAAERSDVCLACHSKDSKRMLWAGSQHDAVQVACDSCHKVHVNADPLLSKATQANVCYTCHKEQRIQVQRPSHHPVPEGKMTCSDCHNVHGSTGPKLVKRDTTNDTCYLCHAEKRGPFVHPHQPATDDCSACHNPHGSTVAGMLVSRPPMLCQQCHTPHTDGGVGALRGQSGVSITGTTNGKNVVNMWQGRSCLNCHTQVHGSNNPSGMNPSPQYLFR